MTKFLRECLESKIRKEWPQKWENFGLYKEDKVNRKTKFYEALAADITKVSGVYISRDTAQRFCTQKGGDSQTSLLAFAKYVGYPSLEAIKSELEGYVVPPKKKRWWIPILMFLLCILGLLWYLWFWRPSQERLSILQVIETANKTQFELYQSLNVKDSLKLDSFYTKNGTARKAIMTILKRSIKNHRRIDVPEENPSYFKIFDKKVIALEAEKATVKTTEHWFLKWYNTETQSYEVSYDVKNEQFYELLKQNGKWKIDHNFFEGKASRIDY